MQTISDLEIFLGYVKTGDIVPLQLALTCCTRVSSANNLIYKNFKYYKQERFDFAISETLMTKLFLYFLICQVGKKQVKLPHNAIIRLSDYLSSYQLEDGLLEI